MAEHPNVTLLKKGYEAFGKGDMGTLSELFDQDATWHEPGENPLSGDHKGRDAVLGFLGQLAVLSNGTIKAETHDILANDEHGVGLINVTGSREGKELNIKTAHVFHIKDGKVTEVWSFPEDQRANDEFWS
ncbi:MAG: nuclear transport factor 2 family protein [Candidatus Adiutricales bacterium]